MSKRIIKIIMGACIMVMLAGLPAAADIDGGLKNVIVPNPRLCNPKNVTYELGIPVEGWAHYYGREVKIELDDRDRLIKSTDWLPWSEKKNYAYTGYADGYHVIYAMFRDADGKRSSIYWNYLVFDSTPPACGGINQVNQNKESITSTDQDYKIETITVVAGLHPNNANRVWMFTWTEKNGQDDMKFIECTFDGRIIPDSNEKFKYIGKVSLSDHNNEDGKYITHVYAEDSLGNMAFMGAVEMIVDKNPPAPATISTLSQVLNADAITIEGTAEAGAKINLSGGTSPVTGTVGADGKFSVNTGLKQNQVNNISVVVEDNAGHISGSSNIVAINEDSTPPTISSLSASATFTTAASFEVNATAVDNGSGIARVVFPTWTTSNWQDDLIWHEGIRGASGNFYYNVNKSEHNNETGQYLTDVYVYDYAGNCTGKSRLTVNVQMPPPIKPTITTASVFINADTINIEGTAEPGRRIAVSGGTSSAAGISGADGKFSVNIGLNQDQVNNITVYAEDESGNKSDSANVTITEDSTPPVISSIFTIDARSGERATQSHYTRYNYVICGAFIDDNFGIQSVKFPTWSVRNWQDDLYWYEGFHDDSYIETIDGDSGVFWGIILDLEEGNPNPNADPIKEGQYFTDVYAYDKAGNYTCKSRLTTIIDTTKPAAPIITTPDKTINADTIYIEGSAEAGSTIVIDNYDTYTENSSDVPTGSNGIFRVNVPLGHNQLNELHVTARDAANNASPESTVDITHTDTPILTAVITNSAGNSTNISPMPVTITFNKAVTGFELNDIVVTNGTADNFSGSGTTYTAVITPVANGLVTVAVPVNAAIDAENNSNTAASYLRIYYDDTQPAVTINATAANPTNASYIPVTITFSESVSGFALGDIVVTNGEKVDFTGSGTTYTVGIKPSADGVVTIDVPAGAASDESGNDNTAASTLSITCDMTKPMLSIAAVSSNISPVAVTFTFSEAVTGFERNDIIIANGTAVNFQGSGTTYTADLIPNSEGPVTINVPAGAATDTIGNGNQAAPSANITFDSMQPTVNISSVIVTHSTNLSSIPLIIAFSEAVTGFDSGDVAIANGTIEEFSGSGTMYTMNVKPNADGIVTVDVPANAAGDGFGNLNTAAAQFTLTYDGSKPSVSISADVTKTNRNTPIPVTITFSEAVTGFELNAIVVANGTAADFTGSGNVYSVFVTPVTAGLVTVNVATNAASDATGNSNIAAAPLRISYDPDKPYVYIRCNTGASSSNVTSIPVNIMFSKAVTGFTEEDIEVSNGALYHLSGSGSDYIADIKTLGQRVVQVYVAEGVAQDDYGNSNSEAALNISNVEIPSLTAQPDDITISVGENASLSVAASVSKGDLTYQWYSNTTDSNSDGLEITGETGSTYSAPAATAGTFHYYCTVTNTDDTTTAYTTAATNSRTATVTIGSYKVTFNNGGATKLAYAANDGTVSMPPDPTRSGYGFGGWYTGASGTGTVFTGAGVFSDTTVYAYWDADNLPVFEILGAEKRTATSSVSEGLRFKTKLNKNNLYNNSKIEGYGIVILPTDLIPAGEELTLATVPTNRTSINPSAILTIVSEKIFSEDSQYIIFTGVLTDIPVAKNDRSITARAYVTYLDTSGQSKTVYSDPVTSSLNEAAVAGS